MNRPPYLSFVAAARNDNYGGDFLRRMQVFLNVLLGLWTKHKLDAELVIVEWNPPEDRPRLKEVIAWPNCLKPGMVRIVEVPKEIHLRVPNSDRMPMFEYIAKNVGIRRARGEYVLATNPDIVFSDALIQEFAGRSLLPDSFYRVDRYDVKATIPLELPVEGQLCFCARRAFRMHRMNRSLPTSGLGRTYTVVSSALKQAYEVARWNMLHPSPMRIIRGLARRAGLAPSRAPHAQNHRGLLAQLHTNASGDFLLMRSERWHELRGFPELKTHSHIDSCLVIMAAVSGLRQMVFCHPVFHQEHDRSEQAARPLTVIEEIPEVRTMLDTGRLQIANSAEWGLGNLELPEVEIA